MRAGAVVFGARESRVGKDVEEGESSVSSASGGSDWRGWRPWGRAVQVIVTARYRDREDRS